MSKGRPAGQLALTLPNRWGGRRRNAGRPRIGRDRRDPHRLRPEHNARHPVHVTMRAVPDYPNLRNQRNGAVIEGAIGDANRAGRIAIVHYSIQSNHIHVIVEADDRDALMRGVQGLTIRLARRLNHATGRRGRVFADRYHPRALHSPREVRIAIIYVLQNVRHHGSPSAEIDYYSNGRWFDGWLAPRARPREPCPTARPTTWLLATGWRERGGGPIAVADGPRSHAV